MRRIWSNNRRIHSREEPSKTKTAEGIAPINGPKNGITFVTPTITPISGANGNLIIVKIRKTTKPTRMESIITPIIYFPKVLSVYLAKSTIFSYEFFLKIAQSTRLVLAIMDSL